MNTTEEKSAIETKESTQKGAYIVCEKATCKCSAGMPGAYSVLKVTSQKHVYINDTNLVATIDDNEFDVPNAPFKQCSNSTKQGQPCEYIPQNKWEMKVGDEHPLINGKKVLTQNAIMKCKMKGEIEIVTHGQTIDAIKNEEDTVNDPTIVYAVNCLIDSIEAPEEKIEVVSIKHIMHKDTKSTVKLKEINLRGKINQEFTAFTNDTKEAQYTYWYVRPVENVKKDIKYNEKDGITVKQLGNKFSIKFFHEGKYLIEGFGRIKNSKGEKKSSISKDCAFLVNVSNEVNLKELEISPSATLTESEEYEIIRYEKYTIKLKTDVDELLPEEIDTIKIEIKDNSLKIVNLDDSPTQFYKQLSFSFSAPNEGQYLLFVTFLNQTKKFKLISVDNQIDKVTTDIQDDKIRPNTAVTFTAQMKKNDNPNCYWYIKKDDGNYIEMCDDNGNNGKFGKISYIFNNLGSYSIEARLRQLFGSKKAEYKEIVVKKNEVKNITSSRVSYVGKAVKFYLDNEFSDLLENENVEWQITYNPQDKGESIPNKKIIEIASSGAKFSNISNFSSGKLNIRYDDLSSKELDLIFNKTGKYSISAKINDTDYCSPFEISIDKAHIVYWDFTDENGTKINKLGWGRDFKIMFAVNGLSSSKVDVNIWHDKGKYTQKDREEGKMDYNQAFDLISEKEYQGEVMSDGTCEIHVNSASFWEKLTDGRHDRKIFFTINTPDTLCDNWSVGMNEKLGQLFPQSSDGTYLTIPKNSETYKMYFADKDEVELKQIISFDSSAKFVAYFYNDRSQKEKFDKYKFCILLYENLKGDDKLVWVSEGSSLNNEGKVVWNIPVSDLKDKISIFADEFQPHFYYVEVKRKNEDSENWEKPITYPEDYQKGKKNDANRIIFEKDDYKAEDVVIESIQQAQKQVKENKINYAKWAQIMPSRPCRYVFDAQTDELKKRTDEAEKLNAQRAKEAEQKNKTASGDNQQKLKDNKNYVLQLKIADNKELQASRYLRTAKQIEIDIESKKTQRKFGKCYCYRDLTENEVRDLIKLVSGKEDIWKGGFGNQGYEECKLQDKSFQGLTRELNATFRKYNINKCIQKIAFLAETSIETGFFQCTGELKSSAESSKDRYKGRGILQMTWQKTYHRYEQYTGNKVVNTPEVVETDLHLAFDSAGWFFARNMTIPNWEGIKWKKENYAKALGFSLNLAATFIGDEDDLDITIEKKDGKGSDAYKTERYFYLISRMLHGYDPKNKTETPANLNYIKRYENFGKIKEWFKYNRNVCEDYYYESEGRAPWMKKALEEAANYGGYFEGNKNKPLYERIKNYYFQAGKIPVLSEPHDRIINGKLIEGTSWCACFASYVLQDTFHTKNGSPVAQYFRDDYANNLNKMKVRKISEPKYGAIVVWVYNNSPTQGHVAFLYGITKEGKYLVLGGNQSDTIRVSERSPKGDGGQRIVGLYYPQSYIDSPLDELTEAEKNYVDFTSVNNQILTTFNNDADGSKYEGLKGISDLKT